MFGLGTLINVGCIILGGLLGLLGGKRIPERVRNGISMANGVCVLFIGIAGALTGLLSLSGDRLVSGNSMMTVCCLAIGTLMGELLNLEALVERFGVFLRNRTGNARDPRFVEGFVTASLTVCIGAMAVVGSVEDGMRGDPSILATKGVLDLVIILVMTGSLGKGCIFSAVPVALVQGSLTLLARLIAPLITEAAMNNLSFIGSILIFCVGVNLVWDRKIRVANMLPALLCAVAAAFLPSSLL